MSLRAKAMTIATRRRGISRQCEHCFRVKRCNAYAGDRPPSSEDLSRLVYLCRPCARSLGYTGEPQ